ncbi:Ltp family lipoprotein [Cytobacillus sp. FSL W7-1323]|uniref:Ltp family lipoprotein n=1 Tax=unclassified Cytobacillus TaxID=2675268 RepID=UPI002AFEB577|nr:Ltp family lipoprotein [Cytobacillus sp. OWB-43]MEA1851700.1 Ltp family lipoprotein [Cytobacillus sp. OWB-43]
MKKFFKIGCMGFIAIFVLGIIGAIFSGGDDETTQPTEKAEPASTEEVATEETDKETEKVKEEDAEEMAEETTEEKEEPKEEPKEEVKEEKEPELSLSQQNAIQTAVNYLDYTAFSRTGLIEQLEYEGYSNEEATYAVDHIEVDWKEQAVQAGKNYLDFTSFSRSGLIDQLVYEGFSQEHATYAVDQIGL